MKVLFSFLENCMLQVSLRISQKLNIIKNEKIAEIFQTGKDRSPLMI